MSAATWSRSSATSSKSAIAMTRERMREGGEAKAELRAEERVLDALVGRHASAETTRRSSARCCAKASSTTRKSRSTWSADAGTRTADLIDIPGMPGAQMGMMNLGDIFGKAFGGRTKRKRMSVSESYEVLIREEADKLLDEDRSQRGARPVEQNGIVFLDEIDKICARKARAATSPARACSATCCR
jgi:ATP-dependent HslUV protease ATP-binding subunit HslU